MHKHKFDHIICKVVMRLACDLNLTITLADFFNYFLGLLHFFIKNMIFDRVAVIMPWQYNISIHWVDNRRP